MILRPLFFVCSSFFSWICIFCCHVSRLLCPWTSFILLLWHNFSFTRCLNHWIKCEPIAAEDLISLSWTLTSFLCVSQYSCCQEESSAGFSLSSLLKQGERECTDLDGEADFVATKGKWFHLHQEWREPCYRWSLSMPQFLSFSTCSPGYWAMSYLLTYVSNVLDRYKSIFIDFKCHSNTMLR